MITRGFYLDLIFNLCYLVMYLHIGQHFRDIKLLYKIMKYDDPLIDDYELDNTPIETRIREKIT